MDNTIVKNAVIAIAIPVVCIALFFFFFEKVEKEIVSYRSDEARKNPFLAAQRFLQLTGVKTDSLNKKEVLVNLPSTDHLIFINKMGGNIPKVREDNLMEWIKQGGDLIITHNKFFDKKLNKSGNNFLDSFGIKLFSAKSLKKEDNKKNRDSIFTLELDYPKNEMVQVDFKENEPANVEFISDRILIDADNKADAAFKGQSGNHILIYNLEKGRLIVFSDNHFLRNLSLDKNDHAYFLSKITRGKNRVSILYASNMPSLFTIFFNNFKWFCFISLILIPLSILRLNLRSGPVYQYRDHQVKNLIEHLDAVGQFQWRFDKANEMINIIRISIEKDLINKHISLNLQNEEDKFKAISKISGLDFDDVYSAFKYKIHKPKDLINYTKILRQIHFEILNNKTI